MNTENFQGDYRKKHLLRARGCAFRLFAITGAALGVSVGLRSSEPSARPFPVGSFENCSDGYGYIGSRFVGYRAIHLILSLALLVFISLDARAEAPAHSSRPVHTARDTTAPRVNTFSIVARDPATGELGVAVQSKYFGVGSVVPWAQAGVGAVATQSYAKMGYGPTGLRLMREGKSSKEALDGLLAEDPMRALRQVGMIDAKGRTATHTGADCMGWAGHRAGKDFTVQGNLLAGEAVLAAMAEAFEKARADGKGELADWLVAALQAGQDAGGDKRGQQSAALLVVREGAGPGGDNDRFVDLRVEDHAEPIKELTRLLEVHKRFYLRKAR